MSITTMVMIMIARVLCLLLFAVSTAYMLSFNTRDRELAKSYGYTSALLAIVLYSTYAFV